MSNDERAIPAELREQGRATVTRIQACLDRGEPVPDGPLWAAADTLREFVDRLDAKTAA